MWHVCPDLVRTEASNSGDDGTGLLDFSSMADQFPAVQAEGNMGKSGEYKNGRRHNAERNKDPAENHRILEKH